MATPRHATSDKRPRQRAGKNKEERDLGIGVLAAGAGYLFAAFLISEPEGGYAAVGPRVFPIGIGIALVAVALWIVFRGTVFPGASGLDAPPAPAGGRAVVPFADWRGAAPSVLLFLAYILLLEPVGYLLTTTAFVALAARLLGSRRWGRDLLASLVVAVTVHALFSLLLGLRLPPGLLGGP